MADLNALADAVIKGDQTTAVEITKDALEEGTGAKNVLEEGLIAGMDVVGARFKNNEIYIPEVLIAARAMKMAMQILEPELVKAGVEPVGKFVIGTVQGDLHDIGKNLVAMMLKGAGFEVIDLGVDVGPEEFVEQVKAQSVHLVGMSALLTTTMPGMEKTIKALKEAGVPTKIMIGGAPVTQGYADKIGADGYAPDAASAVDMAKSLVAYPNPAYPHPKIDLYFKCECCAECWFSARDVDFERGIKVMCNNCSAITFVPPSIFDRHKSHPHDPNGAYIHADWYMRLDPPRPL